MQATATVADQRHLPQKPILPTVLPHGSMVQFAFEQALSRFAESPSGELSELREKFTAVQRLGVDLKAPQFKPAVRDICINLTFDSALTAQKAQVLQEVFGLSETEVQAAAIKALKLNYQSGAPSAGVLAIVKRLEIPKTCYSGVATKESLLQGLRRALKNFDDYGRSYPTVETQLALAKELGISKNELASAGIPDLMVHTALKLDRYKEDYRNRGKGSVKARLFDLAKEAGAREELFCTRRAVEQLNYIDEESMFPYPKNDVVVIYRGSQVTSRQNKFKKRAAKRASEISPRPETEIYAKAEALAAAPEPVLALPPRPVKIPTEDEIIKAIGEPSSLNWEEAGKGVSMLKDIFRTPDYEPSTKLQQAMQKFLMGRTARNDFDALRELRDVFNLSKEFERQLYIERERLCVTEGRTPESNGEYTKLSTALLYGKPLTAEETGQARFNGLLAALRLTGEGRDGWKDGKKVQRALVLYPVPDQHKSNPELEAAACAALKQGLQNGMELSVMQTIFEKVPIRPEARIPLAEALLRNHLESGYAQWREEFMAIAALPTDVEQRIRDQADTQRRRTTTYDALMNGWVAPAEPPRGPKYGDGFFKSPKRVPDWYKDESGAW